MKKILLIIFASIIGFNLSAQNISKDSLSKNWMMWSVKLPQQDEITRTKMNKSPKADFIIKSDGSYNVSFENIGEGTWRYEGQYLIFWSKPTEKERTKIELIAKVVSLEKNTLTLQFITQTVHYDWIVKLVPFN